MRATDHHNRAKIAAGPTGNADLHSWQRDSFSVSKNVRTEQACADPDYSQFVRMEVTGNDASPASAAPTSGTWDLKGYWSLHGYISIQGGTGPIDLQLWAFDKEHDLWYLVEEKANVADLTEFHFDGKVRGRQVYLRVSDIGSVTDVDIYCSAE